MSQSARIGLTAEVRQSSDLDLGQASQSVNLSRVIQLVNGTGEGQANANFTDQRSVGASSSDDLELVGGLNDVFGNSLSFTRINAIAVVADADNGDTIELSGDLAELFAGTDPAIVIRPGGFVLLACPDDTGYAVTDTTAETLSISNNDTEASASYEIVLVGSV